MALKARLKAMLARGRLRRAAVLLAGAALLALAATDTLRLARALRYNAALDAAPAGAAASDTASSAAAGTVAGTDDAPASTLFVRAHAAALAQRSVDAMALYQAASRDPAYAVAAHYNLANLHLREALGLAERDAPASTLFVRAHAAARAQRSVDAMALYQAASRDPAYAVAAHYNLANLHLREALGLAERDALAANPQPAELAKRHYRAALRLDPGHWASKYNLERALRLAPESADDAGAAAGHAADRAITSLRGFTLGLP